jgi:hypothetical protein
MVADKSTRRLRQPKAMLTEDFIQWPRRGETERGSSVATPRLADSQTAKCQTSLGVDEMVNGAAGFYRKHAEVIYLLEKKWKFPGSSRHVARVMMTFPFLCPAST